MASRRVGRLREGEGSAPSPDRIARLISIGEIRPDAGPLVLVVNNWGKLGRWDFHLNKDPQMLEH